MSPLRMWRSRQAGQPSRHGWTVSIAAGLVLVSLCPVQVSWAATPAARGPGSQSQPAETGPPPSRPSARSHRGHSGQPRQVVPAEDQLPVTVTVTQLAPREVRPESALTVVATLTNTSSTATGPLLGRLQRGSLITTRSQLAMTDTTAPPATTRFAPAMALAAGLAPGRSVRVRYHCSAADLDLLALGVYPLSFTIQQESVPLGTSLVGRADTLLPYFPPTVGARPTRVAWLWPLLDRPHRFISQSNATPVFVDDQLARSVAPGGRLFRLLAAAEAVTGRVHLTLAVDPALIESLRLMTGPYQVRSGQRLVPGTGQAAAANWLRRLRRVAPRHLVIAVPYADPDVVALNRGGISALAQPERADFDLLDRELGVATTQRVVWPPAGLLTDTALDDVVAQGASAVVLDSAALPAGSTQGPTQSAVSPLPALGGQAVALVTDPVLENVIYSRSATGGRLAEQRYLAELAMITAEEPAQQRTLVIAPPRRWDPPAGYAGALIADLARISWLSSLPATEAVDSVPPVDRGSLVYPPAAQRAELPPAHVRLMGEVQALVTDFRTALANSDANQLLAPYNDALRAAGSSAWRANPTSGIDYLTALRGDIVRLRGQVNIVIPRTGVYSLASSNSPLSLTVVNQMSKPVRIRVRFSTASSLGFRPQDVGVRLIPARSRTTVLVPAEVQRAGTFALRVQLTSPAGGALGDQVTLTVRSTAYGALALGITGVALLVLVGAVTVRLVRRLHHHPKAAPPVVGGPADRSSQ